MTLVDTSVWVDHFRKKAGDDRLIALLEDDQVRLHEFVIGELYLGGAERTPAWPDLLVLPRIPTALHDDVLTLARQGIGSGAGWVDAHLAAAALLAGIDLYTRDGKLDKFFRKLR